VTLSRFDHSKFVSRLFSARSSLSLRCIEWLLPYIYIWTYTPCLSFLSIPWFYAVSLCSGDAHSSLGSLRCIE